MDVETLSWLPPWDWPADSSKTLASALLSDGTDESTRLLAAELAGHSPTMDDDLVETLLAILQEPDEPDTIRGAAAISLGPTG